MTNPFLSCSMSIINMLSQNRLCLFLIFLGILEDEGASTLLKLMADVDLKDTISGDGPYTLFAPTNAAFAKLDPNLVQWGSEICATPVFESRASLNIFIHLHYC